MFLLIKIQGTVIETKYTSSDVLLSSLRVVITVIELLTRSEGIILSYFFYELNECFYGWEKVESMHCNAKLLCRKRKRKRRNFLCLKYSIFAITPE